jgi:hypothetical protein
MGELEAPEDLEMRRGTTKFGDGGLLMYLSKARLAGQLGVLYHSIEILGQLTCVIKLSISNS